MNWERVRSNWAVVSSLSVLLLAMVAAHFQVWANDERIDDLEKQDKAFTEMDKSVAVIQKQQESDAKVIDTIQTQQQTIINPFLKLLF